MWDIDEDDEDYEKPLNRHEKSEPGGISTSDMIDAGLEMRNYLRSLSIGHMSIEKEKEIAQRGKEQPIKVKK